MKLQRVFTMAAMMAAAAGASAFAAPPLTLTPFKASGIYALGERVGWTVAPAPGAPSGGYAYTVKENNFNVIKSGTLDLSSGKATIDVTLNEPAMLYVEVTKDGKSIRDAKGNPLAVGAAVAPERLAPDSPRPADFDAFWASKIKLLEAVPANPVLTPQPSGKADVDYALIKMDHLNGGHVYGQLAKPHRGGGEGEGRFPGLVIFQYASPPYPLQRQWVTDRAAEGWLALNIEPHDVLPTEPQSYYDALPQALKNYQTIGDEDRDTCYFLKMYLADYRAVEYLASRPDWDGKTLVVMGMSMGGQQSLCVAGLDAKVTHVIVDVPAGCDLNGGLHGRATGYPFWPSNNKKIMATAPYFDAVNFSSRNHATSLVAMGFVDTIAPPVGIWTAFNQIRGLKEAAPMIDSPHNNLATPAEQRPWTQRSEAWLGALEKGEPAPVEEGQGLNGRIGEEANRRGGEGSAAVESVERTDKNSRIAHQQLLEKARQGHIDVYFEGDSITRRWGASDPQSRGFLANWKQNFFGWNAADFGWGGDTTQNILWRLNHGELDNVHPKIIVLLAGTNNVGKVPGRDEQAEAGDITRGIEAIVTTCQRKAPAATIVLMGITPRNDNRAVMPIIDKINDALARFADGRDVRFVSINDKLADKDGRLFAGMMGPDNLHLAVKGYQVWADALKPIFTEVLGPPAATDSAPPPTGDPSLLNSHRMGAASAAPGVVQ